MECPPEDAPTEPELVVKAIGRRKWALTIYMLLAVVVRAPET